jgi:pilus assembly protein Flp/PilA
MKRQGMRFWRETKAVTAIEYGLIAALIAVVILATVKSTGELLRNTFSSVASSL